MPALILKIRSFFYCLASIFAFLRSGRQRHRVFIDFLKDSFDLRFSMRLNKVDYCIDIKTRS